ncbi:MAG: polyhydroxyalkanoate synthesis repressor PhaR [Deltaproteobacteria bacterium]|nr:MAG: polyhydroxyalkanoate synthesis repressor PhaR [Deltaproteobacteria bacterium]
MPRPVTIKKYGNRRLYDTDDSRYITMEELADKIRRGADVRVVDAKTGEDLTQATLTQIVVESRGAAQLLPVSLLHQMIRMGDDALAEFLGQYMTAAMDLYLRAKRGAEAVAPYNPFATLPFHAADALARLLSAPLGMWAGRGEPPPAAASAPAPEPAPAADRTDEVEMLRREIEELKQVVRESAGSAQSGGKKRRR